MAGIIDLKTARPAWYGEYFRVVSGTDWSIESTVIDGNNVAVPWTNCTATAQLLRSNGTVVKVITTTPTAGMQIDLSVAGRVTLLATPACVFSADDLNRPLRFNLLVRCTNPALVLPVMQNCFIVPQANLN